MHPGASLERVELSKVLNEALGKLSEDHRTIIVLREIQGLSYEDIAESMGCHLGTVMSRLHHARKNLQKVLKPYLDAAGKSTGQPSWRGEELVMIERDYELLHRFLDGEMTSAEQQDFERSLAQNTELAAMRRELEEMGRMLRTHVEHELEETDFSNFFAGIEQQLPAMATVGGASQVARNPVAPVDAKPEGGWLPGSSRFWAPALIGAAAAAIALFAVNRPSTPASGRLRHRSL